MSGEYEGMTAVLYARVSTETRTRGPSPSWRS